MDLIERLRAVAARTNDPLLLEAAAALEAAREDAFRLDEIKRSRLAVTPVEGGGWDVTVFDADDYKETLLGSGADMRAAIDEAIDQEARNG